METNPVTELRGINPPMRYAIGIVRLIIFASSTVRKNEVSRIKKQESINLTPVFKYSMCFYLLGSNFREQGNMSYVLMLVTVKVFGVNFVDINAVLRFLGGAFHFTIPTDEEVIR